MDWAHSRAPQVVIAGSGVAASATAIRLLALGMRVQLLVRALPAVHGIEALPRRALELFNVLGLPDPAGEVGAVDVQGPTHDWHDAPGRVPSPSVHLERTVLAAWLLASAVRQGATVDRIRRLPDVHELPEGPLALVDGTGRAAAWSRPVRTMGHGVAWQFRAPASDDMTGRVVRGDGWWAYRLGHPTATWVGIVTEKATLDVLTIDEAATRLGLSRLTLVAGGRRPARVQRAVDPVAGRRIAVGDAVLAHDPLAGQGIRFALGSAIAAATTIATWADDPSRRGLATTYYRDLVEGEEARHLEVLAQLRGTEAQRIRADSGGAPGIVRFGGQVVETALAVAGRVERGPAIRLSNGSTTRWVGAFDLMELARITAKPAPRLLVVAELQELGLDAPAARALVGWAVDNGVLVDGDPASA